MVNLKQESGVSIQPQITLFLPTFNRLEFTKIVLEELLKNTNPSLVSEFIVVDTGSSDGTKRYVRSRLARSCPFPYRVFEISQSHVVHAMIKARELSRTPFIAKVDSDTVVPPEWLDVCHSVMSRHPDLGALGIEPFNPPHDCPPEERSVRYVKHVGGIGLFKKSSWSGLRPGTPPFHGWTGHQHRSEWKKGWVDPDLKVILLDHLDFEPFSSLSKTYIRKKWQRAWRVYSDSFAGLWEWRFPDWRSKVQ